jgi:hypothetical protein
MKLHREALGRVRKKNKLGIKDFRVEILELDPEQFCISPRGSLMGPHKKSSDILKKSYG